MHLGLPPLTALVSVRVLTSSWAQGVSQQDLLDLRCPC